MLPLQAIASARELDVDCTAAQQQLDALMERRLADALQQEEARATRREQLEAELDGLLDQVWGRAGVHSGVGVCACVHVCEAQAGGAHAGVGVRHCDGGGCDACGQGCGRGRGRGCGHSQRSDHTGLARGRTSHRRRR